MVNALRGDHWAYAHFVEREREHSYSAQCGWEKRKEAKHLDAAPPQLCVTMNSAKPEGWVPNATIILTGWEICPHWDSISSSIE
jgi:hypothetical protein